MAAFERSTVKIARRGLTVHSRSGYFALPETDAAPLMPFELPMLAAASSDPPPQAFEYAVRRRSGSIDPSKRCAAHAGGRGAAGTPDVQENRKHAHLRAAVHGDGARQGSDGPDRPALQRVVSARRPDRSPARAQAWTAPLQASDLAASGPLHAVDDRARSGDRAIQRQVDAARRARTSAEAFGSATCR